MSDPRPNPPEHDGPPEHGGPPEHDSRRGALIGLAVIALLVIVGYWLVNSLREEGKREDCMASGRTNCVPLDIPRKD
ncbi:MAG TPA: hypothetical protein VHW66_21080 [Stellaceae bacterium]|jgi:hypothetical protein|nr:hypothetical protein [Stellaceae bacterium]